MGEEVLQKLRYNCVRIRVQHHTTPLIFKMVDGVGVCKFEKTRLYKIVQFQKFSSKKLTIFPQFSPQSNKLIAKI